MTNIVPTSRLEDLRSGPGLLQAHAPTDMLGVERSTSPTVAALLNRSTDRLSAEDRRTSSPAVRD